MSDRGQVADDAGAADVAIMATRQEERRFMAMDTENGLRVFYDRDYRWLLDRGSLNEVFV